MFIRKIVTILIVFTSVILSSSASVSDRKWLFGRTSFGLGHYTSTQTWEYEVRKGGGFLDAGDIAESGRVKNVVSELYPSFNIGAGIGLTDNFILSFGISRFGIHHFF